MTVDLAADSLRFIQCQLNFLLVVVGKNLLQSNAISILCFTYTDGVLLVVPLFAPSLQNSATWFSGDVAVDAPGI